MAKQRGKVGGDKLTVKTAAGEFSAPLTELHDAWWNSIARAMGVTSIIQTFIAFEKLKGFLAVQKSKLCCNLYVLILKNRQ